MGNKQKCGNREPLLYGFGDAAREWYLTVKRPLTDFEAGYHYGYHQCCLRINAGTCSTIQRGESEFGQSQKARGQDQSRMVPIPEHPPSRVASLFPDLNPIENFWALMK